MKKIIRQKKDLWNTCVDIKTEVTRWKPFTLSYAQSDEYPVQVAPNLWAHKSISNQIFEAIKSSALREKKEYVYSICLIIYCRKWLQKLLGNRGLNI